MYYIYTYSVLSVSGRHALCIAYARDAELAAHTHLSLTRSLKTSSSQMVLYRLPFRPTQHHPFGLPATMMTLAPMSYLDLGRQAHLRWRRRVAWRSHLHPSPYPDAEELDASFAFLDRLIADRTGRRASAYLPAHEASGSPYPRQDALADRAVDDAADRLHAALEFLPAWSGAAEDHRNLSSRLGLECSLGELYLFKKRRLETPSLVQCRAVELCIHRAPDLSVCAECGARACEIHRGYEWCIGNTRYGRCNWVCAACQQSGLGYILRPTCYCSNCRRKQAARHALAHAKPGQTFPLVVVRHVMSFLWTR